MQNTKDGGLVLIVEDNRNISEMVGEYLEGRGFEVDYAQDGLDGYRLASENSYDVIVLDLMLPRLDGIEVCRRLRNDARKSTPVLMLTARDTLDEKLTGLSSGADDYLTKPFAIQELEARLRALIRRERRQVGAMRGARVVHGAHHRRPAVRCQQQLRLGLVAARQGPALARVGHPHIHRVEATGRHQAVLGRPVIQKNSAVIGHHPGHP